MQNSIKKIINELQGEIWYQLLMALLALVSGALLVYEFSGSNVTKETKIAIDDIDLGIAYLFLADFIVGIYSAPKKIKHIKENWLDLISSIPISSGMIQALRIARFARLVRILRAGSASINIKNNFTKLHKRRK